MKSNNDYAVLTYYDLFMIKVNKDASTNYY
jgi:hypothetical protein